MNYWWIYLFMFFISTALIAWGLTMNVRRPDSGKQSRTIKLKIAFYLLLSRKCGWFIGAFSRSQTRLLSLAQFRGWQPEGEEAQARLARRQFQLYCWRRDRAELAKLKASMGR